MTPTLPPGSLEELIDAVKSTPRLIAVGGGTKPRLSAVDAAKLSTLRLSGIIEYEPSEFTFTALAGTPVREIEATLANRGQFLPFDPMLVQAGGTLGGTVASGLSGPGRFRFGGVRDFILGVRFVDGAGRLLRMGGKVVKNAAGFDLPKFFVGSLGRFGVLAEITFKVFPRPATELTLKLPAVSAEAATQVFVHGANNRWELAAIDLLPDRESILLRLAGPALALDEISREILARWPGEALNDSAAKAAWGELREFGWIHAGGPLIKIALAPSIWPKLEQSLKAIAGAKVHVSAGGNLAFVSLPSASQANDLDLVLRQLNLSGMTFRGEGPLWLGLRRRPAIESAVKLALDAENRFPMLDE